MNTDQLMSMVRGGGETRARTRAGDDDTGRCRRRWPTLAYTPVSSADRSREAPGEVCGARVGQNGGLLRNRASGTRPARTHGRKGHTCAHW